MTEFIVIFGILLAAFLITMALILNAYGVGKCEHNYEEIVRTTVRGKPVAVHMCKKCGERKITKVK